MPVCVMVMADAPAAEGLTQRLRDTDLPLLKCLTIPQMVMPSTRLPC